MRPDLRYCHSQAPFEQHDDNRGLLISTTFTSDAKGNSGCLRLESDAQYKYTVTVQHLVTLERESSGKKLWYKGQKFEQIN